MTSKKYRLADWRRDANRRVTAIRRARRGGRSTSPWTSLFSSGRGERVGRKDAWLCRFCGVVGSHRRGCHYVTEQHHRGRKPVRAGVLGARARTTRRAGART